MRAPVFAQARQRALREDGVAALLALASLDDAQWRLGYQCRFDGGGRGCRPSPRTSSLSLPPTAPAGSTWRAPTSQSTPWRRSTTSPRSWRLPSPRREGRQLVYVPCLNDGDAHVEALREAPAGSLLCLAIEKSTLRPDWIRRFGNGCRPAFIDVPTSASRPYAYSHLQIPPGDRGARCGRWPRRPASRLRGSFPTC